MIYYSNDMGTLHHGDALAVLRELPAESVHTVVTSPPYWGLRDYGADGQLGMEPTPAEYIASMVEVFREVRRVLRKDGTLWLNMGDGYASSPSKGQSGQDQKKDVGAGSLRARTNAPGLKPKDLIGMPWRLAFALQADGWYLRQDIIWSKPNPMPESVRDRCTKAHEYIFLLSKSPRYYFDAAAIKEPAVGGLPGNKTLKAAEAYEAGDEHHRTKGGLVAYAERMRESRRNSFARTTKDSAGIHGQKPQHRNDREFVSYEGSRNKRSVWTVATAGCKDAHFATFPPALITPCILAGAPVGGTALDPFAGSGTVAREAQRLGRKWVAIEIKGQYCGMIVKGVSLPLLDMMVE